MCLRGSLRTGYYYIRSRQRKFQECIDNTERNWYMYRWDNNH